MPGVDQPLARPPGRAARAAARRRASARTSCHSGSRSNGRRRRERQQHVDAAAVRLADHAPADRGDRVDQVEHLVAARIGGDDAERHRHAASRPRASRMRRRAPARAARGRATARARSPPSKMPAPTSAITPTSSHSSSHDARRDATGRSSDVSWCSLRDVVKPDRAGRAATSASCARIARQVVVGRLLLERALAHRPRAQRRVADVGGVVDALRAAGRRRRGTRGRSPRSSRCRRPAPPGRCPRRARGCAPRARGRRSRTGASVKPQLPITAVVTPCQHELRAQRVPEHLGVQVGVAVDEARASRRGPRRRSPRSPRSRMRPTKAMRSPTIAHVGPVASRGRSRRPRCRCGSPGRTPSVYCYPTD